MTERKNSLSIIWAFLVAQLVKNPPTMQETWVQSLGWEYPLEKGKATHSSIFPDNSVGKESVCNVGDPSSIPGLGRSLGKDPFGERTRDCSPGHAGKEGPQLWLSW